MVRIHPFPEGEMPYEDVEIVINGQIVPAHRCRVSAVPFNRFWPGHQRSQDQTEIAAFVSLDVSDAGERANISVRTREPVDKVWLRPLSRRIHISRGLGCSDDNCTSEINFTLNDPGQYVLEMNDHHKPILFFVNPFGVDDTGGDEDVIRFGAGVHHPGKIRLHSGQTLLVESGAVVYAAISAENANGIRILGGGIIDNSEFPRHTGSIACDVPVQLYNCRNVEIRGVTFRDSCCFTVMGFNLTNVVIDNVKIIGNWRYNSDGIDLYNSANVVVRNSFVRTYDDSIVIKAQKPYDHMNCENWLVKGCVVWCDWGHALEIGAETRADEYRNIRFEHCDIVHSHGAALDVQNNGDALCHDIVFDNIRVEYKKSVYPTQMQKDDDDVYAHDGETCVPPILAATIPDGYCHPFLCGDGPCGNTRHVTFRNIQAILPEDMETVPACVFQGHDENATVSDMIVDGLYVNGRRIGATEADVQANAFASQIHWL